MPLKTVAFEHELVSNAKISVRTMAKVKFRTMEIIAQVSVKTGDRVAKRHRLATLDTYTLSNKMEQAKEARN